MQDIFIRPRRALSATAFGAVVVASTFALAAPAQAVPIGYFNGCTVNAVQPAFRGFNDFGNKTFNYRFTASCYGDRSIRYEHRVYEQDDGPDQLRGQHIGGWTAYNGSSDIQTQKKFNYWYTLHDTEPGPEEIYHQVRIQVKSHGSHGVTSPWSPWSTSPVISVNN